MSFRKKGANGQQRKNIKLQRRATKKGQMKGKGRKKIKNNFLMVV